MRSAVAIALVLALISLSMPVLAQGNGTISGVVTTGSSQAIPDALVTLYDTAGNVVPIDQNPQFTSNGTGNSLGVYTFFDVPPGTYNVTAERGSSSFFAIVMLDAGTATANIVLPDYVVTPEDFPPATLPENVTPQLPYPMPVPYYTFVPATFGKVPPNAQAGPPPVITMLTGPLETLLIVS